MIAIIEEVPIGQTCWPAPLRMLSSAHRLAQPFSNASRRISVGLGSALQGAISRSACAAKAWRTGSGGLGARGKGRFASIGSDIHELCYNCFWGDLQPYDPPDSARPIPRV